jgi:hypothetical protein
VPVGLAAITLAACGGSPSSTGSPAPTRTSAPSASSGPTGSYRAVVRDVRERLIEGAWTVTFAKGGSYTIAGELNRFVPAGPGSYYRGTKFVIYPLTRGVCGGGSSAGTYRLKLSGDKLTFVRMKDPCKARANLLARTFTKVS